MMFRYLNQNLKCILKDKQGSVTKTYVAFDGNHTGLNFMAKGAFAGQNLWVPIQRVETNIRLR